jgi:hypothetical protein
LNCLEELQRKSNNIARQMQQLNRRLEFLRLAEIERTRVHDSGYRPCPAEISHVPTASIFGDVNRAGAPIVDASYAGNSHARFPEDNEPDSEWLHASRNTMTSDVDIPLPTVTLDNVSIIDRNGTKYYRCPCGSETDRKSGMTRHLKSKKHLSPQFPCVCGGRFTRKDTLKNHEKKCRKVIEAQNVLST